MKEPLIETIVHGLEPIALIIRAGYDEPGLHFSPHPIFPSKSPL